MSVFNPTCYRCGKLLRLMRYNSNGFLVYKKCFCKKGGLNQINVQVAKLKVIREVRTSKEIKDVRGWVIPINHLLYVINDDIPHHPTLGYKLIVVRVDNGTGDPELCTETCVYNTDIE